MRKYRKKAEFDLESRKFLTLLLMHPAPKYKFINFNLWGCGEGGRKGWLGRERGSMGPINYCIHKFINKITATV